MKDRALKVAPYLILTVSFILLFARLAFLCFWGDEVSTISLTSTLEKTFTDDRHPFLYYILVYFWRSLFGTNEFTLRALSSLFALCAVWLTYKSFYYFTDLPTLPCRQAGEQAGKKTGILTSFLLSISPFFILFSRMARYYSLALLLSLVSFYLFLVYLKEGNKLKFRLPYILSTSLLFYTNYLSGITMLLSQNLYFLLSGEPVKKPNKSLLKTWLLYQFVILFICLPLFSLASSQFKLSSLAYPAEFSQSLLGQLLKFLYIFYSFCFGETILPLELWITLPGAFLFLFCFFKGIRFLGPLFCSSFIALPIFITLLATSTFSSSVPLAHIARLLFPFAPFFYAVVSAGILSLNMKSKILTLSVFILISSYSLINYFSASHFLNPHYIIPYKEIANNLKKDFKSGDVVLNPSETFDYYACREQIYLFPTINLFSVGDTNKVKQACINSSYSRIWLITRDRGQRNMVQLDNALIRIVKTYGFKEISRKEYVKLSTIDIFLKEKIFHRKFSPYNLTVYLFAR